MRRRVLLLLGLSLLAVDAAAGDELLVRRCGMNRFAGKLHVDVGLQDLFWSQHRKQLRSGFATRVLVRAAVYPLEGDEPVSTAFRRTEIVYDIWTETFHVHRTDSEGRDERFEVDSELKAIRLATALIKFPVALQSGLGVGQSYRVAFRADLNPLSEELVADVRRSLTRPERRRGRLAGDSFFGSFVSVFVNPRIEDSERQLRFVSQTFKEPSR
ncbi:MAG: hypothetical protein KA712_19010 [Myxococcales bacterium]|nr:hypothetical protein [Myxococcales bacterium]